MKIKVKKYDYVWLEGKLHRSEVKQSKLKCYFNSLIVFIFKLINYKHVMAKDYNDEPIVKEILEIRGIRSCRYVGNGGQIVICQFMWKFGKYYI